VGFFLPFLASPALVQYMLAELASWTYVPARAITDLYGALGELDLAFEWAQERQGPPAMFTNDLFRNCQSLLKMLLLQPCKHQVVLSA
jgi:hypothetical protein